MSSARQLARAREEFLELGSVTAGPIRDEILRSWRRSQLSGVDTERMNPPYTDDIDLDSRLVRCALPVIGRLERDLAGTPVSLILTDPHGRVLLRKAGEPSLNHQLDAVCLAPGFSYAEEHVGTNGIGTALEDRGAAHVFGEEHFAEFLQQFSCAGTPIRHPLTRRIEGLVDITSWSSNASPVMRALAREAARDIEQRLLDEAGPRANALLRAFLAATHAHDPSKAVMSFNEEFFITNAPAARLLHPDDWTLLREELRSFPGTSREVVNLQLSGGRTVEARMDRVTSEGRPAGVLLKISTGQGACERPIGRSWARQTSLPGVAGRSVAWRRVVDDVMAAARVREWVLLDGEPGVGRATLVKAIHRRAHPGRPLTIVDLGDSENTAADTLGFALSSAVENAPGTVLLRNLGRAHPAGIAAMARAFDAMRSTPIWVVGTVTARGEFDGRLAPLCQAFARVVDVPPLRYRSEDIQDLVPVLVERHARGRNVRCSPAVVQALLRHEWRGNVAELDEVLRIAVARAHGGSVEIEHLPPRCHSVSGRVLTPLERMERDAIVEALIATKGHKPEAAARLGISRATIYRRIRYYGIEIGDRS